MGYIKEIADEYLALASDEIVQVAAENTPELLSDLASDSSDSGSGIPTGTALRLARKFFKKANREALSMEAEIVG